MLMNRNNLFLNLIGFYFIFKVTAKVEVSSGGLSQEIKEKHSRTLEPITKAFVNNHQI